MAVPEFRRIPEHFREFEREIFLDRLSRSFAAERILRGRALQLGQRAVLFKNQPMSDEAFNCALSSIVYSVRARLVGALLRLRAVKRVFPECIEPVQIFTGELRSAVDRRAAALLRRVCERRGFKVEVKKQFGLRIKFFVCVAMLHDKQNDTRRPLDLVFKAAESLYKFIVLPSYGEEMSKKPLQSRRDLWRGLFADGFWAMTPVFRWLGLHVSFTTIVYAFRTGQISIQLTIIAALLLGIGQSLANSHRSLVVRRLNDRLDNPKNY